MPSQPTSTSKSELSAWQVYLLRLTAFLSPSADFDTANWWKDVVGEPPESQHTNRKLFQQTEVYTYKEANLLLEIQPGRIDWKFTFLSANQPFPHSADELQTERELLDNFLALADRWFNVAPPIIRLAFGAHLANPVQDRTEGYQYLEQYLQSVKLDPVNSSDFLYQINRPRVSSITSDLKVNRLSKWGVAVVTTTAVPLVPVPPPASTSQFYMAHLELDVNTMESNTEAFNTEKIKPIFNELKELALEIADRGDIP